MKTGVSPVFLFVPLSCYAALAGFDVGNPGLYGIYLYLKVVHVLQARQMMRWVVLLILASLLMSACAATTGSNVPFLLEQDYRAMSDQELITYEQELGDEILRTYGSSGGNDVSLGVGFGSWGRHGGVGVGVDQRLGRSSGGMHQELRQRREMVREEMYLRGLTKY